MYPLGFCEANGGALSVVSCVISMSFTDRSPVGGGKFCVISESVHWVESSGAFACTWLERDCYSVCKSS